MEVRDALAHPVVVGDEDALRGEARLDRARDALGEQEQRPDLRRLEVHQRDDVRARDDEDVAGEQRADVEEGDVLFVLEDDFGGDLVGSDFTEEA